FLGLAHSTRFHFLASQGPSPSLRSKRAKVCLHLRFFAPLVVETFWTRLQDNLAQTIHRTLPVLLNLIWPDQNTDVRTTKKTYNESGDEKMAGTRRLSTLLRHGCVRVRRFP